MARFAGHSSVASKRGTGRPFGNKQSEHPISQFANIKVVVVDDDEAVRDSLLVMLSLAGFQVATCKSGAEFLAELEHKTPDCLVLDVHMPDMNGLDLIARLNSVGCTIPVILISGNPDAATEAAARRLGVSHLLKKPFSGAVLIETVKSVTT